MYSINQQLKFGLTKVVIGVFAHNDEKLSETPDIADAFNKQ